MCSDVARNATHRAGHCAARQPTAALSCAGAFSIPEQRSYHQVVSQTMVPRGRAAAFASLRITCAYCSYASASTAYAARIVKRAINYTPFLSPRCRYRRYASQRSPHFG